MRVGKQMQFFGARCNLAKALLYAINGGVDEIKGGVIVPGIEPITDEVLEYDKVRANYEKVLEYTAGLYADTMNIIHYMHDKYAYEAGRWRCTTKCRAHYGLWRGRAFGGGRFFRPSAGQGAPGAQRTGHCSDFAIEGDFPKYGNDDDRADDEAVYLVKSSLPS